MPMFDAPVILPESVRFDHSASEGDVPYRIFLRRPSAEPPAAGWPALYLLDGNAVFATAVEAMRSQARWPSNTGIREAVIVAIGYPTEAAYDGLRRAWDYTPPPGRVYPSDTEGGPLVRTGGANGFLDFVERVVKPEVERRVPIDRRRLALFGHSFGGLCVLHTLFHQPSSFSHWIAASPSIFWEEACVLDSADAYAALAHRPAADILISAGAYEQALAPFQAGNPNKAEIRARQAEARFVDHARALSDRLDALPEIRCRFSLLPNETHMSVIPIAINQAIRFVFGIWD